jgi:hypothetical protein
MKTLRLQQMVRCQNQKKMEQAMKRTLQKTLKIRRLILQSVKIPQVLFTQINLLCPWMCALIFYWVVESAIILCTQLPWVGFVIVLARLYAKCCYNTACVYTVVWVQILLTCIFFVHSFGENLEQICVCVCICKWSRNIFNVNSIPLVI